MLPSVAQAQVAGPWIDGHVHFIGRPGSLGAAVAPAIKAMDADRIRFMIVMPTPQPFSRMRYTDILDVIGGHAGRFRFLGGGGSLNPMPHEAARKGTVSQADRRRFEAVAQEILGAGAVGFGGSLTKPGFPR